MKFKRSGKEKKTFRSRSLFFQFDSESLFSLVVIQTKAIYKIEKEREN